MLLATVEVFRNGARSRLGTISTIVERPPFASWRLFAALRETDRSRHLQKRQSGPNLHHKSQAPGMVRLIDISISHEGRVAGPSRQ